MSTKTSSFFFTFSSNSRVFFFGRGICLWHRICPKLTATKKVSIIPRNQYDAAKYNSNHVLEFEANLANRGDTQHWISASLFSLTRKGSVALTVADTGEVSSRNLFTDQCARIMYSKAEIHKTALSTFISNITPSFYSNQISELTLVKRNRV